MTEALLAYIDELYQVGVMSGYSYFKLRSLAIANKLEINDGDLVIIRYSNDFHSMEQVRQLASELADIFSGTLDRLHCGIVMLPEGIELETFSEEEMEELGWYKLK